jgi:predicted protein tyrosine phosphatase
MRLRSTLPGALRTIGRRDVDRVDMRVRGLHDGRSLAFTWADHIVSIAATDGDLLTSSRPDAAHTILLFRDTLNRDDPEAFTHDQAQQVLDLGAALYSTDPAPNVLVHCAAGINRSPSVAYGLRLGAGFEPAQAWHEVIEERPEAGGNALVIAELDIALNAQREVWFTWAKWASRHGRWHGRVDRRATDEALRALVTSK